MTNYFVKDNNLFNKNNEEIVADEKGIVSLVIDGVNRKFVKEKYISWLTANPNQMAKPLKIRKNKETGAPVVPKRARVKKPVSEKHKKTRAGYKIVLIKGGVESEPFPSISRVAKHLKVAKSTICKILNSKQPTNNTGYEFKKVS